MYQTNSFVISPHTLANAVADGTITDYAAFCGLMPDDIDRLAMKYADARILVRLRTKRGDASTVMSVGEFIRWRERDDTIIANLRLWNYSDIRDVFPVALDSRK